MMMKEYLYIFDTETGVNMKQTQIITMGGNVIHGQQEHFQQLMF